MKLSRYIPIVLIAAFSLFPACDVLEDPIVPFSGGYNLELYGNPPVFQMATTSGKNVLVEDFTAHQCGNCPPAAEIAEGLAESNPDRGKSDLNQNRSADLGAGPAVCVRTRWHWRRLA